MTALSTIASSPASIAAFLCGAVLLFLVINRTLKRRRD